MILVNTLVDQWVIERVSLSQTRGDKHAHHDPSPPSVRSARSLTLLPHNRQLITPKLTQFQVFVCRPEFKTQIQSPSGRRGGRPKDKHTSSSAPLRLNDVAMAPPDLSASTQSAQRIRRKKSRLRVSRYACNSTYNTDSIPELLLAVRFRS
jgi:hypothetical protein